ncbi:TIGR03668 family PPOX class F420-dependent oxidoreductase [Peterkaempfera bronchialis]|uniref:TIGR03668 family PPOX class F420-dependent oxidoreductase n=1 Tax=Peterkaempfera bronchialis TaxID=2126346 RepID=A0A345T492_9ACTN|nr:TIGR03668 family PPOX class F420-dependent oxidoreductase [Peterkaempfera bronchialis]AXI80797.1 TIGR03668 family PPOX class F420-dependent oxidoreductase [Peterkaempfera bronchialis]
MPSLEPPRARVCFAACRIARLATADAEGRPHLVPVVFAVDGDTVVTAVDHKPKRSTRLRRLADIAANPAVCLLADGGYQEDWALLWWAQARGRARVVPADGDPVLRARAVALLCAKYPQYRERPPAGAVIAVEVTRWLGWRAS